MSTRHAIALVTSAEMPKPDPESHLLVAALAQRGIDARLIPWDSEVDWSAFPLVLVRTPWDYFRRLPQFLAWAEQVQARTLLLNPCAVLAWNSHKRYLKQLAQQGLAHRTPPAAGTGKRKRFTLDRVFMRLQSPRHQGVSP